MADSRLLAGFQQSTLAFSLRLQALRAPGTAGVSDEGAYKNTQVGVIALGAALVLHGAVLAWLLLSPPAPKIALSAAGRPTSGSGVRVTLVSAPSPSPQPVPKRENVTPPTPVTQAKPTPRLPKVLATRTDQPLLRAATVTPDNPAPKAAPPPQSTADTPKEAAPAPAATKPELNLSGSQAAKSVDSVACHIPAPIYPMRAKRLGETGTVKLRISLDTAGHVADVSVASSSGYDDLDGAAIEAVKAGHCAPYSEGGHPVPVFAVQPLTFELN